MPTTRWKLGQSGLWTDPAAWSGSAEPGSASDVVIAALPKAAGFPYAIALQGNAAVHSIRETQAAATLAVSAGTLGVSGTYELRAGTVMLSGATVQGGTLASTGGAMVISGSGTLSGVRIEGTLGIQSATTRSYAQLSLPDESFAGAGGHGAGALVLGQRIAAGLGVAPTLKNVAITLNGDTLEQAASTLTIGAAASVSATGQSILGNANALTNQGRIAASGEGSVLAVDATVLLNQGTIDASGGAALLIEAGSFANAGVVSVGAGSYLRITTGGAAGFANTGSIAVAGGTLSLDTGLTTAQLATLAVSSGTLAVSGTLDNTGAVLRSGFGAGLANMLLEGGTITAGTIVNTGSFSVGVAPLAVAGPYDAPDSLLSGVTFDGVLNVKGAGAKLDIAGGLALTGTTGSGAGTLEIGGTGASVTFVGSQTLDHARIDLGSTAQQDYQSERLLFAGPANGAGTLVLGRHTAVTQTGLNVAIGTTAYPGVIDILGTVTAARQGGMLDINGCANAGMIAVSDGDTLHFAGSTNAGTIQSEGGQLYLDGAVINAGLIAVSGTPAIPGVAQNLISVGLANTGVLSISNGATASLGANWSNTGIFAVADGELSLGGSFTRAQLGALRVDAGGTLGLLGTLTSSGLLAVGSGTALPSMALLQGGTIEGGAVRDAGGGILAQGGTLSGVTVDGVLSLAADGANLVLQNGASVAGTGGSGRGSIVLTGAGSSLAWHGDETLDHATVSLGGAGAGAAVGGPSFGTLTLGGQVVVQQTGGVAALGSLTSTVVNDGRVLASQTGGTLSLLGTFYNAGTIGITADDTVSASTAAFTNAGLIAVGAGSVLALQPDDRSASGSLAAQSLTNFGTVTLAGGMLAELTGNGLFPPVPLLNAAGGRITGAGVVVGPIDNDGLIDAHGTLTLVQSISGNGVLRVDPGATLVLGGAGSGQTAWFAGGSGVLGLQPARFLGTIGGFAAGDTIDLLDTVGRSAAFCGDTVVVTLAGGATLALDTTAGLTGALSVTAGSHGDTLIRYASVPHDVGWSRLLHGW